VEAFARAGIPRRAAFDPHLRRIAPDRAGDPDAIEPAAEDRRAAAR